MYMLPKTTNGQLLPLMQDTMTLSWALGHERLLSTVYINTSVKGSSPNIDLDVIRHGYICGPCSRRRALLLGMYFGDIAWTCGYFTFAMRHLGHTCITVCLALHTCTHHTQQFILLHTLHDVCPSLLATTQLQCKPT